jgi:hypothetical protein
MFDLTLCLSASVNVIPILHTQPLGLYNKILVGYLFVHRYLFSPPPFLLISSILQMVNTTNRNANAENNNAENNNVADEHGCPGWEMCPSQPGHQRFP